MKILFVNTREPRCGVHQYGISLYRCLEQAIDDEDSVAYWTLEDKEEFTAYADHLRPDAVIYNWQAGVGGWLAGAPFDVPGKKVFAYHDLAFNEAAFDAVLFSDSTMVQHQKWHPIGRPLRGLIHHPQEPHEVPVIGINGFIGAWAQIAFSYIANTYEHCHLRMHLPYAVYGDADGALAHRAANECRSAMTSGMTFEVRHDFMEWDELVRWLAGNDLNCYLREPIPWRGVSSALDPALCARRPIAINRCGGFRHLHDCKPSIMVEDRGLREIMQSGLSPLLPKYQEYDTRVVGEAVLSILKNL